MTLGSGRARAARSKRCRALITALALAPILASCASSYEPIVDMKGVDPMRYQADLAECRTYAEQGSPATDAAVGAGLGAAAGAATGAVIGAITGAPGRGAAIGAAGGGTAGLFGGGTRGVSQQRQIIQRCLQGRGYNVLG